MRSILAMVLLAGCALGEVAEEPVAVHYIDPQGTQAFDSAALDAARMWTEVGCPIEEAHGDLASVAVLRVVEWDTGLSGDYDGFYDGYRISIRSDYTVDAVLQKRMMLHEMGHMLGMPHREWGVMKPYVTTDVLTIEDCAGEPLAQE